MERIVEVNGSEVLDPLEPATENIEDITLSPEQLANMSPHEIQRWKRQKYLKIHKGHEDMHFEMLLVLFATYFFSQIAIIVWKKKHVQSFNVCTLVGMWIIPVVLGYHLNWYRFLTTWFIYTIITFIITMKAKRKPLSGNTPSLVYGWFFLMFRLSCFLGFTGYILFVLTFFGLGQLFLIKQETAIMETLTILLYGLYYGVMSRDFAEICSEWMASTIGYYTRTGMPNKYLADDICAICGESVNPSPMMQQQHGDKVEKICQLSCGHKFHEFCIRGWCIIGKKQTCPYCKEKVDLKRMFPSPWERPQMLYGNLLDWVRYSVAWQPLIILLVQTINWSLGLK